MLSSTSSQPKHTNKLINEKSPYLLQHAHNPVNWFPWGDEAIANAKSQNKPIFLSVGYSTCHWCHVMEHESFEDEEVAKLLNENFISIKVDREERPDVDRLYMSAVTMMNRSGGWPMSVFITPDLKPFFAGTYFPPVSSYGRPSFKALLVQIAKLWSEQQEELLERSDELMKGLKEISETLSSSQEAAYTNEKRVASIWKKAIESYIRSFDSELGGFGGAPKFPRPSVFDFLFAYSQYCENFTKNSDLSSGSNEKQKEISEKARNMAIFTLEKICQGGIFDQIAGGFHRYSVDEFWHVPHFEKMLYDQSQLIESLLTLLKLQYSPIAEDTIKKTIEYVFRDMTFNSNGGTIDGGFYSAEDADSLPDKKTSVKEEGAFYVWEYDEIFEVVNALDISKIASLKESGIKNKKIMRMFCFSFGIKEAGNIRQRSDPHGELSGKNHLFVAHTFGETAKEFNVSEDIVKSCMSLVRSELMKKRDADRPRPHLDDKVLTTWNGLMISSLTKAYQHFGNEEYINKAIRAANFLKQNLFDEKSGELLRSWRETTSSIKGFLSDYSFTIKALLGLYETTGDVQWLEWAAQLQEKQKELFWDNEKGGYFDTQPNEHILIRNKGEEDGAEPSGNSISAQNLIKLYSITHNEDYVKKAEKTIGVCGLYFERAPTAAPQMLVSLGQLNCLSSNYASVVLCGPPENEITLRLKDVLFKSAINKTIVQLNEKSLPKLKTLNSFFGSLDISTPKAYVCLASGTCKMPTQDPQELEKLLNSLDG